MARRARRGAAAVHGRRRLGEHADLGHGDREPGPDRRRAARGLPHEPGRQQAPDPARRAGAARRTATSRSRRGVDGDAARSTGGDAAAVDRLAPRVRGRQQRRVHGPVRVQGQRRRGARLRDARPEQPVPRPARRHVRRGAPRRRASCTSTAAAAPRSPTSTWTACSTSSRSTSARRCGSGGTSAAARPTRRRRWATGSALPARASPAATATRSARSSRRRSGDPVHRTGARSVVGGGHIGGQLGWTHVGIGPATEAAGPRDVAGRRGRARGRRVAADRFCDIERGSARAGAVDARQPEAEEDRRMRSGTARHGRPAGLRHARPRVRSCPPRRYAERGWPRSARARRAAGYDRLVVYADREHSANLAFLTGFDPRFEEAMLVVGPDGDPLILVGNECYGMAGAAPLPMRARAVPGLQPAQPAARPVAAAARDPGGGGDRRAARGSACSAGSRTRTGHGSRSRRSSWTSCARSWAAAGSSRTRTSS